MDKIIIRNLLARGCIGISDSERSAQQDILINVVLYTDTKKAAISDSIDDCINYSTMSRRILRLAENNHRKTVEAFAEDIANDCLDHEMVKRVMVRVEKTSAVRFTQAVGVEIEREK